MKILVVGEERLQEIVELSRVPCVGEYIILDGGEYSVEWVLHGVGFFEATILVKKT